MLYRDSRFSFCSPEEDLWRNALSKLPTLFERLLYLASLWDPQTGDFHHFGLAQQYGKGRVNSLLRANYLELLRKWNRCPLKDRQIQMGRYWAARASNLNKGDATDTRTNAKSILTPRPYWRRRKSVLGAGVS